MSSEQKLPADIIRMRRSGARLAAVQALYQLELTDRGVKAVIREFMEDRLGLDDDGVPVGRAAAVPGGVTGGVVGGVLGGVRLFAR